ncbi:MAG: peptide-methionine (R)-S-oxide reductase MsrB [Christensenellaceae bacterium]
MPEILNIRFKRPSNRELKERLDAQQYEVMVNNGTELPHTSEYCDKQEEGIYVDNATGEPLFTSYDKFTSQCGWPSFSKAISDENIKTLKDLSHGMVRVEVRSSAGDFHLGHLFSDGPKELGGLRYCINGAAIRFIPLDDMETEGYSFLLPYMKKRKAQAL